MGLSGRRWGEKRDKGVSDSKTGGTPSDTTEAAGEREVGEGRRQTGDDVRWAWGETTGQERQKKVINLCKHQPKNRWLLFIRHTPFQYGALIIPITTVTLVLRSLIVLLSLCLHSRSIKQAVAAQSGTFTAGLKCSPYREGVRWVTQQVDHRLD